MKERKHHNNKRYRSIKIGNKKKEIRKLAKELGVKFEREGNRGKDFLRLGNYGERE